MRPPEANPGVLVAAVSDRRSEAMRVAAALRVGPLCASIHIGSADDRDALITYAAAVGFSVVIIFRTDGVSVVDIDGSERTISSEALASASAGDASKLSELVRRR